MRAWLERQRYLLDFTLSSLARRRRKTVALLAIYTLLVFALASVLFFTTALREQATVVLRDAPDLVVQRMAAGRHERVPAGYVDTLRGLQGVSGARGRLWGYYQDRVSGATLTVMVPQVPRGEQGDVVLGPGVARVRQVGVHERFPMLTYEGDVLDLRVIAVEPSETEVVAADLVLLGETDFRALFAMEGEVFTDVAVSVPNPQEIATVARKATQYLSDVRVITRADMVRTYEAVLDWRSGLAMAMLTGAVLAFAILAWDRAAGLSVEEQREIGVLKAIGWETTDVLRVKLWEGAAVSLSAFLAGVLLAYLHVFVGAAFLFRPVLEGWSALYPDLRPVPFVSGLQVVTLFALSVIPYTLATLVPSWRAATVDPDTVMRA